jgi:hypothetical protein
MEEQWNYRILDQRVIKAGYHGERGTWVCHALLDLEEGRERFLFYSMLGLEISPAQRPVVIEYITRANCGLTIGNFEMNVDTGEVRFKTSMVVPAGGLSVTVVRSLAYANVHTIDRYFPGVLAVVLGGQSPAGALARIDHQPCLQLEIL